MLYRDRVLDTATAFPASSNYEIWSLADFTGTGTQDLCCVKRYNTESNMVEVHVASMESRFQKIVARSITSFPCSYAFQGVWKLADIYGTGRLDLCYILAEGAPSRMVEVHVAVALPSDPTKIPYKAIVELVSRIPVANEVFGFWDLADMTGDGWLDLIQIKTRNTASRKVELVYSSLTPRSSLLTHSPALRTFITSADAESQDLTTWSVFPYQDSTRQDAIRLQTSATRNRAIELQVFSSSGKFRERAVNTATCFGADEERLCTWLVSRFTHNVDPDLVCIKPTDTASGRVEVHILSAFSATQAIKRACDLVKEGSGGWRRDSPDYRDDIFRIQPGLRGHCLQDSVDLRENCPPFWQSSSTDFTTPDACAALLWYHTWGRNPSFQPSRQFLRYEVQAQERLLGYTAGASIRTCLKILKNTGICDEALFPSSPSRSRTMSMPHQYPISPVSPISISQRQRGWSIGGVDSKCYEDASKHRISSFQRIPKDVLHIKACLAQGIPIIFAIENGKLTGMVGLILGYCNENGEECIVLKAFGSQVSSSQKPMAGWSAQDVEPMFPLMPLRSLIHVARDLWTIVA